MKVEDLLEAPALFARRNLQATAKDWIETNPGEVAAILHFVDDGDEQSAYAYLSRDLRDEKLLKAVMAELFYGSKVSA